MIHSIIFDLDGTLLDTLEDLRDSVNYVLALHGMPERSITEIRNFIGNGIPTLIRRSIPEGTSDELWKTCVSEMKNHYKDHAKIKTKPYDGIPELLDFLKKNNIKTAVVTNKAEESAKILCSEFFGDVFTAVIGDDGINPLKPAPDNVLRAVEEINAYRDTTLYVGDSDVDMITAKNASLQSAGVLWGFRSEKVLRESGAKYIVSTPSDIKKLI